MNDERRAAPELLFAALPIPAWVFDVATLRFLDVNEAAVRTYGWSRGDFLRMTIADIRPPEDVPALRRHLAPDRPAADRDESWRHRTRSGDVIEVRIHSHEVVHRGVPARLVVAEDVTERVRQAAREREATQALRESEARFRAVFESVGDGLLITDLDDVVLSVNPAFERLLGWSEDDLLGRRSADFLLDDEGRAALRERLRDRALGASDRIEERLLHRDGSRVWVETVATPLRLESGEVVGAVGAMTGVGRRRAAEASVRDLTEQLHHRATAYERLAEFGAEIERMQDVDALIGTGLERLTGLFGMDAAAYYEVREDRVVPVRWVGLPEAAEAAGVMRELALGEGIIGAAARSGRADFTTAYAASPHALSEAIEAGIASQLTIPVRVAGRVRGVLSVASFGVPVPLSGDDRAIAAAFVRRLGNAIERVEVLDEVRATREATFRAFGVALEHRSYETKGHTDRVVALARRVGEALGFDPEALQALQWGAYLHDIGKIAISDAILLKPGRLTDDEYERVKAHTVVGDAMLADQAFLPHATRAVVRHHHERWDGSGYPDGRAGVRIPVAARVFALVDVFDALTSERPYKRAWSVEAALREIAASAGTQFDPELTRVFLRVAADATGEA